MNNYDKKAFINRLMEALGAKTQKELANFLNTSQSTISTWHSTRKIYLDDIVRACPDNTDWNYLMLGKRSITENPEDNQKIEDLNKQIIELKEEKSKQEYMISKLLSEFRKRQLEDYPQLGV